MISIHFTKRIWKIKYIVREKLFQKNIYYHQLHYKLQYIKSTGLTKHTKCICKKKINLQFILFTWSNLKVVLQCWSIFDSFWRHRINCKQSSRSPLTMFTLQCVQNRKHVYTLQDAKWVWVWKKKLKKLKNEKNDLLSRDVCYISWIHVWRKCFLRRNKKKRLTFKACDGEMQRKWTNSFNVPIVFLCHYILLHIVHTI